MPYCYCHPYLSNASSPFPMGQDKLVSFCESHGFILYPHALRCKMLNRIESVVCLIILQVVMDNNPN